MVLNDGHDESRGDGIDAPSSRLATIAPQRFHAGWRGGDEVKTTVYRLTVDQYEQMIEAGILPESNRYELIRGQIVEKDVKRPEHPTAVIGAKLAIERLLPPGWHARQEAPVRIPSRRSEPEPDVSVARGAF